MRIVLFIQIFLIFSLTVQAETKTGKNTRFCLGGISQIQSDLAFQSSKIENGISLDTFDETHSTARCYNVSDQYQYDDSQLTDVKYFGPGRTVICSERTCEYSVTIHAYVKGKILHDGEWIEGYVKIRTNMEVEQYAHLKMVKKNQHRQHLVPVVSSQP